MSPALSILDALRSSLDFGSDQRFIIAISGGLDSHVLLHCLASLCKDKNRLVAVHIDHELHQDSNNWARYCLASAAAIGVAATVMTIDERPSAGENVESWGRRQRYALLASVMSDSDVVLTAHHRDDVAETFLLQLFRGAGPHGLSSIVAQQPFGRGSLVRPLLNFSQDEIKDYAQLHNLRWIEDPSNSTDKYNRNFLRHRVLPLIEQRWPAVTARIAHAVKLQQEAASVLDEVADAIVEPLTSRDRSQMAVAAFDGLDEVMQRLVLRRWIVRARFPIPDTVHLKEMLTLLRARPDAQPCVRWKGVDLRRYRGTLYLQWSHTRALDDGSYQWDLRFPLALSAGQLTAVAAIGQGLSKVITRQQGVVVRFRRGGERCQPLDRSHSQTLKRLFQEWGVPTWRRSETPLVFIGDELAAVADICICRPFAAAVNEPGWTLSWRRTVIPGNSINSEHNR